MSTLQLLFLRSTGLGACVAELGEVHPVDLAKAREFIARGRAVPAPGESEPDPASAMTTQDPDHVSASTPKKGRKS